MGTKIKRAGRNIMSMVNLIDPKASAFTTLEQAWEIIANYWDLEGDMVASGTKADRKARFTIYYKNVPIHTCEWNTDDVWSVKDGEFDWLTIYKDVLEWLIKSRTLKKSRIGKGAKARQLDLPTDVKKEIKKEAKKPSAVEEPAPVKKEERAPKVNIEALKKRKQQLYHKIRNDRKKGLQTQSLEAEYSKILEQINRCK